MKQISHWEFRIRGVKLFRFKLKYLWTENILQLQSFVKFTLYKF